MPFSQNYRRFFRPTKKKQCVRKCHFHLTVLVVIFMSVLGHARTNRRHDLSDTPHSGVETRPGHDTSDDQNKRNAKVGKSWETNLELTKKPALGDTAKDNTKQDPKKGISSVTENDQSGDINANHENDMQKTINSDGKKIIRQNKKSTRSTGNHRTELNSKNKIKKNGKKSIKSYPRKIIQTNTSRGTQKDTEVTGSVTKEGTQNNKKDDGKSTKTVLFSLTRKTTKAPVQLKNSASRQRPFRGKRATSATDFLSIIFEDSSPQFSSNKSASLDSSVDATSHFPSSSLERHAESLFNQLGLTSETSGTSKCNWNQTDRNELYIEDDEGRLEWEESMSNSCCSYQVSWHIKPAAMNQGLVLHFTHFNFKQNESLEVYEGGECKEDKLLMRFPNITTAVQLLPHREVYVWVRTSSSFSSSENSLSSFSLNYSTHPLQQIPVASPLVPISNITAPLTAENHTYNCSHPYTVPPYIQCDMVQQCIGGEDEPDDCPYKSANCSEGWFPSRRKCLKIINVTGPAWEIYDLCSTKHSGEVAIVPEPAERKFVGDMIARMGIQAMCLYVDLKLPALSDFSSKQLLYQWIWHWGKRPYVNHGDSPRPSQSSSTTSCNDRGHFFISHGEVSVQCEIDSGCQFPMERFLCMKTAVSSENKQDLDARNDTLTLQPAKAGHSNTSHGNTFQLMLPNRTDIPLSFKACSDGSFVHVFHRCLSGNQNTDWSPNNLKPFDCMNGEKVHYSLVCDGYTDCPDGSDEWGCSVPYFTRKEFYVCASNQIIPLNKRCDGAFDCLDASDERFNCEELGCLDDTELCANWWCVPPHIHRLFCRHGQKEAEKLPADKNKGTMDPVKSVYPPAIVHLDGFGSSRLEKLEDDQDGCPDTHFQCPEGFCIPTYLLNNKVWDCPLGHDENITNLICPGFYRCYKTSNCLHPDFLCDGVNHCPLNDDELYCAGFPCENTCICEGHTTWCPLKLRHTVNTDYRYIDLSGVYRPAIWLWTEHLLHLNLSFCNFTTIDWSKLTFLRVLDLSYNNIDSFESFDFKEPLQELLHLNLSFNPISVLGNAFTTFVRRAKLIRLQTLTMKGIGLEMIMSNDFENLPQMSFLDISFNPGADVEDTMVFGQSLRVLYTDDPKLCCPHFHSSQVTECHAPVDELSSCSDLLRSDTLRVLLWTLSTMALTGNMGVLVYRVRMEQQDTSLAYRLLVINLSAADFIMGVYMAIIGGADIFFRGIYLTKAEDWRHSGTCKVAGFLAMLSSEVSAFVICLITLDRLLVLRFSFNERLHLSRLSASLACGAVWIAGVVLATIPLTQSQWDFYGQNSICLPLPITRQQFEGQQYAFGVFIVLNFILFLFIGAGQSVIYYSIRSSSKATQKNDRKEEMAIARRLFLIVFTDFCCWFPIGLMGLLAARGTPIPGLVNVWTAVFVLPLNSAINPFLYTINMLLEKRHKKREQKRLVKMMSNLQVEIHAWPRRKVEELIFHCLSSGLVQQEGVKELILDCLKSKLVRPKGAKELILHCLSSELVNMDELRTIYESQLNKEEESTALNASLVDLQTGTTQVELYCHEANGGGRAGMDV